MDNKVILFILAIHVQTFCGVGTPNNQTPTGTGSPASPFSGKTQGALNPTGSTAAHQTAVPGKK